MAVRCERFHAKARATEDPAAATFCLVNVGLAIELNASDASGGEQQLPAGMSVPSGPWSRLKETRARTIGIASLASIGVSAQTAPSNLSSGPATPSARRL